MKALWMLLAIIVAGCVEVDDDWARRALTDLPGHDHADPGHHQGRSTDNFEVLGFTPFFTDHHGGPTGAFFCGDAKPTADGRRLAAVESRTDVGFIVLDVTDPASPFVVGELVMENTYVYDLAVMPDGVHVVLVTAGTRDFLPGPVHTSPAGTPEPLRLTWRSCTATTSMNVDPTPYPANVLLVDITGPDGPAVVDVLPGNGFGHSVFADRLNGVDWVLATFATVGQPVRNVEPAYTLYSFAAEPRPRLEVRGEILMPPLDGLGRGHDGWLAKHPVTGRSYAYLAGGDTFAIVDVTDPRLPSTVATWTDPQGGEGFATVHSARPLPGLLEGRHYTVVGPEYHGHPEDSPGGIIWVIDTTEPSRPTPVAAWSLPYDVEWAGQYMFSAHYFDVVETTLFVSQYHGGLWAVDLSGLGDGFLLPSIGVFLPAGVATVGEGAERWSPTLEEVLAMPDGTLVTFDGNHGLYTLRFDAERPAPAPPPWPVALP